jgi:hypothetical protein
MTEPEQPEHAVPATREDAARVLAALFVNNADRGDDRANDDLVAEMRRRAGRSRALRSDPVRHRAQCRLS